MSADCKDCIERAEPVTPADPFPADLAAGADALAELLGTSVENIVPLAIRLLRWTVTEIRSGRALLSGDPENGTLQRLVLPEIETTLLRIENNAAA
jgi:hypothetical protein